MHCPQCQQDNPPGARFCNGCGARLEMACPACNHVNPSESRFCNGCGHKLGRQAATDAVTRFVSPQSYTPKHLAEKILTSKAALEGERKQVTVLFADLKGLHRARRSHPLDSRRTQDRSVAQTGRITFNDLTRGWPFT
jgi:hypothetical protein